MTTKEDIVRPNRAEIRCKSLADEHVQLFLELYEKMQLPTKITIEERMDIDVCLFNDDELLDQIGIPHKD
jgi:hypothetical protein